MKLIAIILYLLISWKSFALNTECKNIYLNVGPGPSKIEQKVALKLAKFISKNYSKSQLAVTYDILVAHLSNDGHEFDKESLIIDYKDETDLTGSEVYLALYKTDLSGDIKFMGSHMIATRFNKEDSLIDLAKIAINLSCSNGL